MKKKIKKSLSLLILSGLFISMLSACCIFYSVAAYDTYSYTRTITIRDNVTVLINQATESYTLHEKEIEEVKESIKMIYEYEMVKCKNKNTVQQWEVVKAPEGTLYKFFDDWKQKSTLSKIYSSEMAGIITKIFNNIIETEAKKRK